MADIIVNKPGSPVQINIREGISQKNNAPYKMVQVTIGKCPPINLAIPYGWTEFVVEEVKKVLAEGADAILSE